MDYNLKAERPNDDEDATQPKPVIKYQNNMGFKVKDTHNVVYAITTVELRSNKYPKWISKLFHLHNKKVVTPISQHYLIAFEKTGLLLMGVESQEKQSLKGFTHTYYYFDGRNSFFPKSKINDVRLANKKREKALFIKAGRVNMPFEVPQIWLSSPFQEPNYRNLDQLVNRLK